MCGDFNLDPPGERRISVANPGPMPAVGEERDRHAKPFQARWEAIFEGLTEIKCPMPNHFHKPDLTASRLNRIFINIPRSAINLFKHNAGIIKDPVTWHSKGLSDHSPCLGGDY